MSEFIAMSPFILPLLLLVFLLGAIWRHDTLYQLQEARASKAASITRKPEKAALY